MAFLALSPVPPPLGMRLWPSLPPVFDFLHQHNTEGSEGLGTRLSLELRPSDLQFFALKLSFERKVLADKICMVVGQKTTPTISKLITVMLHNVVSTVLCNACICMLCRHCQTNES